MKRQPPPHRRNRNTANNIFISERAEQQRRILNITSTAQNETPFAISLSLQFWHEQNTGAYKTTPYYFNMEERHNIPPNKRTCSRKEINALQAEDIIPHCNPTNKQPHNAPINQEDHTGEIIPFNRTSSTSTILNALCLIWTTNKQKGLLFALYRIIRKRAAQHTTKETRRAHTANK